MKRKDPRYTSFLEEKPPDDVRRGPRLHIVREKDRKVVSVVGNLMGDKKEQTVCKDHAPKGGLRPRIVAARSKRKPYGRLGNIRTTCSIEQEISGRGKSADREKDG